jgi:hypothetical protein
VAEVIENAEKAEDYALNYIDDLKAQQREKDRENGFNN